jgi:uncharacterized protein (TIGR00251 family)
VIALHETPSGITFAVRVQPRAKRNAILGELGDAVKISLTAPPVDGRANEACIEFLAELLRVPRSAVNIISGESSRNKVVRVSGCTAAHLRKTLDRCSK